MNRGCSAFCARTKHVHNVTSTVLRPAPIPSRHSTGESRKANKFSCISTGGISKKCAALATVVDLLARRCYVSTEGRGESTRSRTEIPLKLFDLRHGERKYNIVA